MALYNVDDSATNDRLVEAKVMSEVVQRLSPTGLFSESLAIPVSLRNEILRKCGFTFQFLEDKATAGDLQDEDIVVKTKTPLTGPLIIEPSAVTTEADENEGLSLNTNGFLNLIKIGKVVTLDGYVYCSSGVETLRINKQDKIRPPVSVLEDSDPDDCITLNDITIVTPEGTLLEFDTIKKLVGILL